MIVQKIFSTDTEDRLFSVLLSEDEYQRFFANVAGPTVYDRSDAIKGMYDNDILAEKKRSNSEYYKRAANTGITGAAIGTTVGALAAAISRAKGGKASFTRAMKAGAIAGGALGATGSLMKSSKERSENEFVNNRLEYAQRQARRREAMNWHNNTVNREGYTSRYLNN